MDRRQPAGKRPFLRGRAVRIWLIVVTAVLLVGATVLVAAFWDRSYPMVPESYTVDATGTTLVLTVMGEPDPATVSVRLVRETPDEIVVEARIHPPQSGSLVGVMRTVAITLGDPLADRTVLDITGAPIPPAR